MIARTNCPSYKYSEQQIDYQVGLELELWENLPLGCIKSMPRSPFNLTTEPDEELSASSFEASRKPEESNLQAINLFIYERILDNL